MQDMTKEDEFWKWIEENADRPLIKPGASDVCEGCAIAQFLEDKYGHPVSVAGTTFNFLHDPTNTHDCLSWIATITWKVTGSVGKWKDYTLADLEEIVG